MEKFDAQDELFSKMLRLYLDENISKEQRFQFERHGYFVADRTDHQPEQPVFNLAVGLKDQWKK